jgi:uncharacterized membrane protein
MNLLPEPLHPAVVHFPVVLILLGTVAAAGAVFWRRHHLPLLAALLLALGAVGAWVAVETGESDGGLVERLTPPAEALLDAHQDWAGRTLALAAVAAVMAGGAIALVRVPRLARATAVAAALTAVAASFAVYQTGHRGGALVFRHGAGVAVAASADAPGPAAAPVPAARTGKHDERD